MFRRIRSWGKDKNQTIGTQTTERDVPGGETYRYSPKGDSELRNTVLSQLFGYGITDEDPAVRKLTLDDLFALGPKLSEQFWNQERAWIEANLSKEEVHGLRRSRADHGIGTTYDQPLITRPMDYSTLSGHRVNSLETAWKLVDRGITVSRTAMDRHSCCLSGLSAGNLFFDAWDADLEQKRQSYATALAKNREAAKIDFKHLWGEVPPNLGEEYDYLEYTQASNRISKPYRDRDKNDGSLELAVTACHSMIERTNEFKALFHRLGIDLPGRHHGFYQLSVILDKQSRWEEAIQLCSQAIDEGWPGDWEKRIDRYQRKLDKQRKL